MRDPNRLYKFYGEMVRLHMTYMPDIRAGQLMYNFTTWLVNKKQIDIFFPEEDELIKLLKEYMGEKNE